MSFYTLAKARYSCRSMSDRPVSKEAVSRIIAAGMAAPTACNYQPFRIWVMESAEALAKIKSCTKQKFVLPAPVVFVIGACPEEGWVREFDSRNFAAVDATIAATHMISDSARPGSVILTSKPQRKSFRIWRTVI